MLPEQGCQTDYYYYYFTTNKPISQQNINQLLNQVTLEPYLVTLQSDIMSTNPIESDVTCFLMNYNKIVLKT